MKKVLGILVVAIMAIGFLGVNLTQACGCKCNCGCQSTSQQKCTCGCHQGSTVNSGCPCSKEDFAKAVEKRRAYLNTELGLTKVQQDKAKIIFDSKMKDLGPVISEIKAKKQALKEFKNTPFELTKIKTKKEQKALLKADLKTLKEKRKAITDKYDKEFEAVLTDAQKTKWTEIKKAHCKMHKHRHHKKHFGCPKCGCEKN